MGWFFDKKKGTKNDEIFVPEWGWVGSNTPVYYVNTDTLFSSPSGDGLVQGDDYYGKSQETIFVPAWGMGWFA